MKIAVFLDLYEPLHHTKDGNILLGLLERGATATLITIEKPCLRDYTPPFHLIQTSHESFTNPEFWRSVDADIILAYTWLNRHYNPIVRSIKSAGKLLIIRADRDGRIGYPLIPRLYYTSPIWTPAGLGNLARRTALRILNKPIASILLRQFILADAVCIESSDARENLAHLLTCWNRPDLLNKVHRIPIAISDDFITSNIPKKERRVVAVGRWNDRRVKNTDVAIRVLNRLLAARASFSATMIGTGEKLIEQLSSRLAPSPSSRFIVRGNQSQSEVAQILGESMVLFLPSLTEAFPLAAGEAASMGCTVVGGPLEAVKYLARGGSCGTVASGFDEDAMLKALLSDTGKWESGDYDPAGIANASRGEFDRRHVADKILTLARDLTQKNS